MAEVGLLPLLPSLLPALAMAPAYILQVQREVVPRVPRVPAVLAGLREEEGTISKLSSSNWEIITGS